MQIFIGIGMLIGGTSGTSGAEGGAPNLLTEEGDTLVTEAGDKITTEEE